jgi:hypothetical protein
LTPVTTNLFMLSRIKFNRNAIIQQNIVVGVADMVLSGNE